MKKNRPGILSTNVIFASLIVAVCGWWLAVHAGHLWLTQYLSMYIPLGEFAGGPFREPGFLVVWTGKFLTQFFYYPALGIAVLLALLTAVQYLLYRATRVPARGYPFFFIPVAAAITAGLGAGYMVWVTDTPELLFQPVAGLAVTAFMVVPAWKRGRFMFLIPLALTAVFYPFAGAYALAGGILATVVATVTNRGAARILSAACGTAAAVVTPIIYRWFVFTALPGDRMYTAPLPKFNLAGETVASPIPWTIMFLSVGALSKWGLWYVRTGGKQGRNPARRGRQFIIPVLSLVAAMAILFCYTFRNENFRKENEIRRAMYNGEWERVAEISTRSPGNNTRMLVMSGNLAWLKLGKAAEQVFAREHGTASPEAPFAVRLDRTGGGMFYYYYGLPNYAYRWCMEAMVKTGPRADLFLLMAKCALLSGENDLARRYLSALGKTIFYRRDARYYMQFADGSLPLEADPEFAAILPLTGGGNMLDSDGGNIEGYLSTYLTFLDTGNPGAVEASLIANMMEKNPLKTLIRFGQYAASNDRIPPHYQQAAMLFAYIEGRELPWPEKMDAVQMERFMGLAERMRQAQADPARAEQSMREYTAGTYWHYYLFGPGITARDTGTKENNVYE